MSWKSFCNVCLSRPAARLNPVCPLYLETTGRNKSKANAQTQACRGEASPGLRAGSDPGVWPGRRKRATSAQDGTEKRVALCDLYVSILRSSWDITDGWTCQPPKEEEGRKGRRWRCEARRTKSGRMCILCQDKLGDRTNKLWGSSPATHGFSGHCSSGRAWT